MLPAVEVLKISNPVAGLDTGFAELSAVNVIRGGKNPLSVAAISSFADACGVDVPIPVWAKEYVTNINKTIVNDLDLNCISIDS